MDEVQFGGGDAEGLEDREKDVFVVLTAVFDQFEVLRELERRLEGIKERMDVCNNVSSGDRRYDRRDVPASKMVTYCC